MAEHYTISANTHITPSFFELNASEVLDKLICPALSKVCDFLGWKYYINIKGFNVLEDFSPVVSFLLQYFYLRKRNASLGEAFYGLQRVSIQNNEPNKQHFKSALVLIFLPYLENKLKERAANHENEYKLEKYILKGISIIKLIKVFNMITYLAKAHKTHSPILRALGIKLSYAPVLEENSTSYLLKFMELFAFFIQFMQWWYTRPGGKTNFSNEINPSYYSYDVDYTKEVNSKGLCPICLQKINNATASGISGFVFCWKCIVTHLKNKKTCPVTEFPMELEDLIRIYDDEE